jgi:hypothetical protein
MTIVYKNPTITVYSQPFPSPSEGRMASYHERRRIVHSTRSGMDLLHFLSRFSFCRERPIWPYSLLNLAQCLSFQVVLHSIVESLFFWLYTMCCLHPIIESSLEMADDLAGKVSQSTFAQHLEHHCPLCGHGLSKILLFEKYTPIDSSKGVPLPELSSKCCTAMWSSPNGV